MSLLNLNTEVTEVGSNKRDGGTEGERKRGNEGKEDFIKGS